MEVKPKKQGLGLEMKTFTGSEGENYLVFKTKNGSFHVFMEVEAKQAARQCGSKQERTTRQMWANIWNSGSQSV